MILSRGVRPFVPYNWIPSGSWRIKNNVRQPGFPSRKMTTRWICKLTASSLSFTEDKLLRIRKQNRMQYAGGVDNRITNDYKCCVISREGSNKDILWRNSSYDHPYNTYQRHGLFLLSPPEYSKKGGCQASLNKLRRDREPLRYRFLRLKKYCVSFVPKSTMRQSMSCRYGRISTLQKEAR